MNAAVLLWDDAVGGGDDDVHPLERTAQRGYVGEIADDIFDLAAVGILDHRALTAHHGGDVVPSLGEPAGDLRADVTGRADDEVALAAQGAFGAHALRLSG